MAEVGNLDTYLGLLYSIFIIAKMCNFLEKITDPITGIIKVVELMVGYF